MSTFSVNKMALEQIQYIICENKSDNPVVMLLDMAKSQGLFDGFTTALFEGVDYKQLTEIGGNKFKEIENQLTYYLDVAVYEREVCQPELLIEISGVTFVMASNIFEALQDYCLIFDGDHFLLTSTEGTKNNLLSVMTGWGEKQGNDNST